MSDLNDNIQRIAKTKELQELVEQLIKKSGLIGKKNPISGDRSVSYDQAGGGVGNKKSSPGTVEADDPGSDGSEDSNEDGSGNDDGGGNDGDTQNSDKDELDLQDLLDNGAQIGDRIGSLSGLTDCGGGNEGIVYMDGDFRPYDWGGVFDDYGANDDPRESQFVAGTYYVYNALTTHNSTSVYGAVSAGLGELDSNDPGNAPHAIVSIDPYDQNTIGDGGNVTVNMSRASGSFTVNASANVGNCSVGVDSYCPASTPFNQNPSDGVHQLRFDGGQFQTSERENDADIVGPWGQNNGSGGPSKISGCASGGETVDIEAVGNGNSQVTFGNGDSYTLDSDGVVIDVI